VRQRASPPTDLAVQVGLAVPVYDNATGYEQDQDGKLASASRLRLA